MAKIEPVDSNDLKNYYETIYSGVPSFVYANGFFQLLGRNPRSLIRLTLLIFLLVFAMPVRIIWVVSHIIS